MAACNGTLQSGPANNQLKTGEAPMYPYSSLMDEELLIDSVGREDIAFDFVSVDYLSMIQWIAPNQ